MPKLKGALAVGAAVLLCSSAFLAEADARTRRAQGQVQGPRGSAGVERTTTREKGQRSRTTTVTGEKGRSTTVTDTQTRNREEGTYSRDRDRTFANGDTRSVDVDAQRTGEGTFTANRTVTGRNGETRTQTGDFAVTKTDDGRSVSGAIQTQNHGSVDYQRDVSRADGARTVSSSATFEDGTSLNRSSAMTRDAATGAITTVGSATNRQGQTITSTAVRTPTDTGGTYSRDTTFADGTTRNVDRTRTNNGDGTATIDGTVTTRDGETRTQTVTVTKEP